MISVRDYLRRRRKAELQTIHQFWYPGESRLSTRDDLEKRVAQALTAGLQLDERLARLSKPQVSLLTALLGRKPDYAVEVRQVHQRLEQSGVPKVEVDSVGRMLVERGFIDRRRIPVSGEEREVFLIPAELGLRLEEALETSVAELDPAAQLTQKRLDFDIDFEGRCLDERIESLQDERLRRLVRVAIERRGMLELGSGAARSILEDVAAPESWREELERAGIGTIGPIALGDFGIVVQAPAVIVLQEWIGRDAREKLGVVEEPDTVVEAGVDLYIDVDRLSMMLLEEPGRLTREGKVPKRVQDRLRAGLHLERVAEFVEGDVADQVLGLTSKLGVVERYGGELRVDEDRLRLWRKLDLTRQCEIVMDRFASDKRGSNWSFHQEVLRELLIDTLREVAPRGWISFESLVSLVVSTYLLELEEREVRETLRELREEEFSQERLSSSFPRLGSDLVHWVVHRLLVAGVCELGYLGGKLSAFRLTPLGKKVLGVSEKAGERRVLVNPDFEIILFCEGLPGQRLELSLSRFGDRVSAERIRRYRVTRETVRYGIRSGLSVEQMQKLLEEASDYPLPESIGVDLRDWGKDLDWISARPAVWLSGVRSDRAEEVRECLSEQGYQCYPCGNDGLTVVSSDRERAVDLSSILELLRERGWLVRAEAALRPALESNDR